jgi:uncharacterized protein
VTALPETPGRLGDNILYFGRALRKAGLKVSTAQVNSAIEAIAAAGFTRRDDFYYALRATLVTRAEHLDVFEQVFRMFWRDPQFLEQMMRSMLPLLQTMEEAAPKKPEAAERRAAQALWDQPPSASKPPQRDEIEIDAALSWSESETLRGKDFEQMSAEEQAEAATMLRRLRLPIELIPTRRYRPATRGTRPDSRGMFRQSLRRGGEVQKLQMMARGQRPPNLVALCDISGSMTTYSRMMMHFLHALTWAQQRHWGKVHAFTFGTRLTNITRALSLREVDHAMDALGQEAPDWQGGTRIGDSLARFNRLWSRRVLGQGSVVLLITDGLERGGTEQLTEEAQRLSRSTRRLIWLNPLLRFDGFRPEAAGVKALLPLVDSLHSCHSVDSLEALGQSFATAGDLRPLVPKRG